MSRSLEDWRVDLQARWARGVEASARAVVGASTDTRTLAAGQLFIALRGPNFNGAEFVAAAARAGAAGAVIDAAAEAAVLSASLDLPVLVVDDTLAALQRAGAAQRNRFQGVVVAVAGSNGKTTVKEMIAAVLAECGPTLATAGNLNNHIGVPLTLLRLGDAVRFAVIEIGANHPGEVAQLVALVRPQVAIVTNAGAEHLEGFGDIAGAARAEGELFEGLDAAATAIINADDDFAGLWRSQATRSRRVQFGLGRDADVRAEAARHEIDEAGFLSRFALIAPSGRTEISLRLAGMHNVRNAAGAAAAALSAGASLEQVRAGLAKMRPVKGRLQFKRAAASGAWLLDDTYNANPSSMQAALEVLAQLPGPKWFVAGAMGELGAASADSHRELGRQARKCGVERLFGFGADARLTVDTFGAGAQWYADIDALREAVAGALTADVRLLVKGSRANRLERVVDALTGEAGAAQRKVG
jgi:UDP-N-acetylmuramoyl-tripeptide--D-alanyl-D-alanine ligase